MKLQYYSVK